MSRFKPATMSIVICVVLASCTETAFADKPNREQLRDQCERILTGLVNGQLPEDAQIREMVVWKMRSWPTRIVEERLVAALDDKLPNVRYTAAEILLEKTKDKHEAEIRRALKQLQPATSHHRARHAAIRFRLGEKGAREEVRRWAVLRGTFLNKLTPFMCVMHPQIRTPGSGKCPICAMELIEGPGSLTQSDYHAQYVALAVLAEQSPRDVPTLARGILVGKAGPLWRLRAAQLWARVEPQAALPHLQLFLHSTDAHVVQETAVMLAQDFAKSSGQELKAAMEQHGSNPVVRLTIAEGLAKAGHQEHLEEIRQVVKAEPTPAQRELLPIAILAMGECGTADDATSLALHLKGAHRFEAAAAILKLLGHNK